MKRRAEELGEHALSAVIGDLSARTVSAAVGRYEARESVDDQLHRLDMLRTTVHSAVEVAEGVHIRSWWLRRWLWRLRDAALDGDEVLRLFKSRPQEVDATRQQQHAGGNTLWNAAACALRSARSLMLLLLSRDDDDPTQRLRRALAALEREAKGIGEFLKLLNLEIRNSTTLDENEDGEFVSRKRKQEEQLVAASTIGRVVRRRAATCALIPDADELHDLVGRILRALDDTRHVDLLVKRNTWLDKWRGELQAVASRAERVLLTLPVKASPEHGIEFVDDDAGEEVRRMVKTMEAAGAHLEDFVTLVGLARRQRRSRRHRQRFFFLSLILLMLFSVCVAAVLLGWRHGCLARRQRLRTGTVGVLSPAGDTRRQYLCAVWQH